MDFLHLGVKRAHEDPGIDQSHEPAKRSKQDDELKRSIKKKLRHLPRKVSFFKFILLANSLFNFSWFIS